MIKVALHSAPRSGSTWLGNIFNSHPKVKFCYQPLFSYAFKDYLTPQSSKEEIEDFFYKIRYSNDSFINQEEAINRGIVPKFTKQTPLSHCCYKEVRYHHILENMLQQCEDIKLILLVRNPLAVLHSWRNAPREFRSDLGWNFLTEWQYGRLKNDDRPESYYGYEKWKECCEIFLKLNDQYSEQVQLINFEQLLLQTESCIQELFEFTGLDMDRQVLDFINQSKSKEIKDSYSVFKIKQKDDNWKQLPPSIIDFVEHDLRNSKLERFLNGG